MSKETAGVFGRKDIWTYICYMVKKATEQRHTCTRCKKKRAESVMHTVDGYNWGRLYGPKLAGRGYVWQCNQCPEQKK